MLKVMFVISLLAVLQTSPPVPGKTSQGHRADTSGNKEKAAPNKPPMTFPSEKTDAARNDAQAKTAASKNADIPVTVAPINVEKDRWDYASIVASLLIALVTMVLAWTAWIQANAAKSAVEVMWTAQRPQLALEPHGNPPQDLMSNTPRVRLELFNRGLTTAYDLVYESWIEVLPFPFEDFSPSADYVGKLAKTALYPQRPPLVINLPLRRGWQEGQRDAVKELKLYVCFRIRAQFRDARNLVRYANFGIYVMNQGFGFLPKYNDAD